MSTSEQGVLAPAPSAGKLISSSLLTDADSLRVRLEALHERTQETPNFNPVFQLSLEISRALESGSASIADLARMVSELECESLQSRAARLVRVLAPLDEASNREACCTLASAVTTFEELSLQWSSPMLHVVFTAHPTFLLTPAQSDAIADGASSGDMSKQAVCTTGKERPSITLAHEHHEAMAAIAHAQDARDILVNSLLQLASDKFPDHWRQFRPMPFRFATWVGYDMDGRTDIGWTTSIHCRLMEKAIRLARYANTLDAIAPDHDCLVQLRAAQRHTKELAGLFANELSDPEAISRAANRLAADHPAKLTSLVRVIDALELTARDAEPAAALALLTLVCAMKADGLGMGGIQFRVNASQLHNAIRRRIDPENTLDLASKTALIRLRLLLAEVHPLRTSFAALAIENT